MNLSLLVNDLLTCPITVIVLQLIWVKIGVPLGGVYFGVIDRVFMCMYCIQSGQSPSFITSSSDTRNLFHPLSHIPNSRKVEDDSLQKSLQKSVSYT